MKIIIAAKTPLQTTIGAKRIRQLPRDPKGSRYKKARRINTVAAEMNGVGRQDYSILRMPRGVVAYRVTADSFAGKKLDAGPNKPSLARPPN
jgi:hypothetical protein